VAALLLGFGAVVAALRGRDAGRAPPLEVASLAWAFVTLGLAILPLFLVALGASGATLWRASSAAAGLVVPGLIGATWLAARSFPRPARPSRLRLVTGLADAGAFLLALASLANAAQLLHPVTSGPYMSLVLWLVLASALRLLA
jgi:hypothetical protein